MIIDHRIYGTAIILGYAAMTVGIILPGFNRIWKGGSALMGVTVLLAALDWLWS